MPPFPTAQAVLALSAETALRAEDVPEVWVDQELPLVVLRIVPPLPTVQQVFELTADTP